MKRFSTKLHIFFQQREKHSACLGAMREGQVNIDETFCKVISNIFVGPEFWPKLYKTCGGKEQTPIALTASGSVDVTGNDLTFSTDYDTDIMGSIKNDGTTSKV